MDTAQHHKEAREEDASRNNTRRIYMSLLPIQAFSMGLPAINTLLDSLIIGNFVGTEALAAVGFYSPIVMLVSGISAMVTSGAQLLCGQAMGRADKEDISRIYTEAIVSSVVFNLILTLLAQLFSTQIAVLLGAGSDTLEMTADYIRGISLGYILSCLNGCFLPFLQLEKSKNIATVAVAAMLIVNVAGDVLSVFVFHGGMLGIGLATTASFLAAVLIAGVRLVKSQLFHFDLSLVRLQSIGEMLRQGFPTGITFFCTMIRNRVINYFVMAFGGTTAMSAMSVAGNINTAMGNVLKSGYEGAGRMIASVLAGQRDTSTLRDLPKIMVKNVWWMMYGLYALLFILAGPLAMAFGAKSEDLAVYILIIRLYNLWYLSSVFKTPPLCVYQGMGKVNMMTLLGIANALIIPVGSCLIFGNLFGLPAVVSCNFICELVLMLLMAVIFWVQAKRPPRSILELAYIPSSLSAPRENRYKATIRTQEEAVKASQDVIDFCLKHNLSRKTAYYCGLCVEEMVTDTIKNGFNGPEDDVDLRVILENGHVRILLRDTGREFSPLEWLALCKPEDQERSIGIRMVSKMATEMNYVNTLGMNLLTIVI